MIRVLLCLLITSTAIAAEPDTRTAVVGKLVVIDATSVDGQSLTWHAFNASADSYLVCDGGKRIAFASPRAGSFTFLEVAAKADGSGGVSITLQEHRVTITGGAAPPVDPGTPAPPVSRFGLESRIRAAVLKVPAEHRTDKSGQPIADGLRVAYLEVINQIDKGTITTVGKAMESKQEAAREILGEHLEAWLTTFGAEESAAMKELAKSGQMKTLADHRQALFEIATGLTP